MCAAEDWNETELFLAGRHAYPYRNLTRADFDEILVMLSEGIASSRGRYAAYLHRDRVNGVIRARRGSRLAAITSGGGPTGTAVFSHPVQPARGQGVYTFSDIAVRKGAGGLLVPWKRFHVMLTQQ